MGWLQCWHSCPLRWPYQATRISCKGRWHLKGRRCPRDNVHATDALDNPTRTRNTLPPLCTHMQPHEAGNRAHRSSYAVACEGVCFARDELHNGRCIETACLALRTEVLGHQVAACQSGGRHRQNPADYHEPCAQTGSSRGASPPVIPSSATSSPGFSTAHNEAGWGRKEWIGLLELLTCRQLR